MLKNDSIKTLPNIIYKVVGMIKYCPTCPRSTKDTRFIGEFCEQCIISKTIKTIPDRINVIICKSCGKVREVAEFVRYDKTSIGKIIQRAAHNKFTVSVRSIENNAIVHAKLTYPIKNTDESVVFEKDIAIKFLKQTCIKCVRKHSGYYQAIIQLRGDKEHVENMKKKINRFLTRRDSFITKTKLLHNGEDLYIEDKNKIKSFFNIYKELKPKVTYTLSGMKNGKRLYRHTYYVYL